MGLEGQTKGSGNNIENTLFVFAIDSCFLSTTCVDAWSSPPCTPPRPRHPQRHRQQSRRRSRPFRRRQGRGQPQDSYRSWLCHKDYRQYLNNSLYIVLLCSIRI